MAKWGEIKCPRCEELEAKLDKAVDFCRRLERLAMQSEDWFVFDKCQEILDQLLDKTDARPD